MALVAGWYVWSHSASKSPAEGETAAEDKAAHEVTASGVVKFAETKWKVAGIQLATVARTTLPQSQRVTGTLVDALLIRSDAILVEANQPFVFVHLGEDQFERRNVQTGRTGEGSTEITAGLREGESVVVEGAFFLKSEMLADQFADED